MGVIFKNGLPYAGSMTMPMIGATSSANGESGLVPAPQSSERSKFFKGDGTWDDAGHVVVDENGTEQVHRSKLKFVNAEITDDSTHDMTIITVQGGGTSIVQIPSVVGTSFTYNGNAQGPQVTGLDTEHVTITNATKTNVGEYVLTASLKDPSKQVWSDLSTADRTFSYSIVKKNIEIPNVSGTFTYDGDSKSCTITNTGDSAYYTQSGYTSRTSAGTFNVTFSLNDTSNTQWTDGTTSDQVKSWSIARAVSAITVNPSSITLNMSNKTGTSTVSNILGRSLSVSSSNTSIATASISNDVITINHVNQTSGSATITVTAEQSTNYEESSISISVTASFVSTTLNDNSWNVIQSVAQAGNGSSYWNVGDRKAVSLNGTVRARTLSNYTWYCYILGFNHNASTEGDNTIHFQFGFNALSDGVHTALTDWTGTNAYGDYGDKVLFNMNKSSSNTNVGGWNSCTMRTVTIPEFKECLPSELKSVLKAVTKYTDNTGNSSNVAANVTTTLDEIFLLAEYEYFGTRTYANQYEYTNNKQAQYAYYAASNSRVFYNDQVTGTAVIVWERSPRYGNSTNFCHVYTDGSAGDSAAYYSFGFAPGFTVG